MNKKIIWQAVFHLLLSITFFLILGDEHVSLFTIYALLTLLMIAASIQGKEMALETSCDPERREHPEKIYYRFELVPVLLCSIVIGFAMIRIESNLNLVIYCLNVGSLFCLQWKITYDQWLKKYLPRAYDLETEHEQAGSMLHVRNHPLADANGWVPYNFENKESRPALYGRYLVMRKDGKVHWEVWNGSGWAYNENSITHWKTIELPCA